MWVFGVLFTCSVCLQSCFFTKVNSYRMTGWPQLVTASPYHSLSSLGTDRSVHDLYYGDLVGHVISLICLTYYSLIISSISFSHFKSEQYKLKMLNWCSNLHLTPSQLSTAVEESWEIAHWHEETPVLLHGFLNIYCTYITLCSYKTWFFLMPFQNAGAVVSWRLRNQPGQGSCTFPSSLCTRGTPVCSA